MTRPDPDVSAESEEQLLRPSQRPAERVKSRGRHKRSKNGRGNVQLVHEMEGGYKDSSSRSSSEATTPVNEKWHAEKPKRSVWKLLAIILTVPILLSLFLYGSYRASNPKSVMGFTSNGTHAFAPTTILISLDGFRADFLQRGLTPAMKAFVESGVSPRYMLPSFPSLTFPNHFTLVTGLYPESHGIVSNQFWDPNLQEEFYYTNISNSMQPKWWNAEPVWVTAEKAGIKSAVHMWPGSEAHVMGYDPTYLDNYNGTEALDIKVHRILQWLDMPAEDRPQLILSYVPNVDADGHLYGPNSTEIRATIAEVDNMLTNLIEGLFVRNLTEIVNLVVVSDHGMATTANERLIQLDDIIDMSLIDHIDGWPLRGLRTKSPDVDVPVLYQQLLKASRDSPFDVYTVETMPARYHFSDNPRIAPLWVVPHAGWAVVEKTDFDIKASEAAGIAYHPIGLHGYDHEHPLMRAIFIARGPAFSQAPNSRLAPFQNIEVYNIICDSLGIKPRPNNGTLRLPLVPEGTHSEHSTESVPADPPISISSTLSIPTTTQSSVATSPSTTAKNDEPPSKSHSSWWDFLHHQIDKAKEWAKELIDSIRNNKPTNKSPQR